MQFSGAGHQHPTDLWCLYSANGASEDAATLVTDILKANTLESFMLKYWLVLHHLQWGNEDNRDHVKNLRKVLVGMIPAKPTIFIVHDLPPPSL